MKKRSTLAIYMETDIKKDFVEKTKSFGTDAPTVLRNFIFCFLSRDDKEALELILSNQKECSEFFKKNEY